MAASNAGVYSQMLKAQVLLFGLMGEMEYLAHREVEMLAKLILLSL